MSQHYDAEIAVACELCGRHGMPDKFMHCSNYRSCHLGRCPLCFPEILRLHTQRGKSMAYQRAMYRNVFNMEFVCGSCTHFGAGCIIEQGPLPQVAGYTMAALGRLQSVADMQQQQQQPALQPQQQQRRRSQRSRSQPAAQGAVQGDFQIPAASPAPPPRPLPPPPSPPRQPAATAGSDQRTKLGRAGGSTPQKHVGAAAGQARTDAAADANEEAAAAAEFEAAAVVAVKQEVAAGGGAEAGAKAATELKTRPAAVKQEAGAAAVREPPSPAAAKEEQTAIAPEAAEAAGPADAAGARQAAQAAPQAGLAPAARPVVGPNGTAGKAQRRLAHHVEAVITEQQGIGQLITAALAPVPSAADQRDKAVAAAPAEAAAAPAATAAGEFKAGATAATGAGTGGTFVKQEAGAAAVKEPPAAAEQAAIAADAAEPEADGAQESAQAQPAADKAPASRPVAGPSEAADRARRHLIPPAEAMIPVQQGSGQSAGAALAPVPSAGDQRDKAPAAKAGTAAAATAGAAAAAAPAAATHVEQQARPQQHTSQVTSTTAATARNKIALAAALLAGIKRKAPEASAKPVAQLQPSAMHKDGGSPRTKPKAHPEGPSAPAAAIDTAAGDMVYGPQAHHAAGKLLRMRLMTTAEAAAAAASKTSRSSGSGGGHNNPSVGTEQLQSLPQQYEQDQQLGNKVGPLVRRSMPRQPGAATAVLGAAAAGVGGMQSAAAARKRQRLAVEHNREQQPSQQQCRQLEAPGNFNLKRLLGLEAEEKAPGATSGRDQAPAGACSNAAARTTGAGLAAAPGAVVMRGLALGAPPAAAGAQTWQGVLLIESFDQTQQHLDVRATLLQPGTSLPPQLPQPHHARSVQASYCSRSTISDLLHEEHSPQPLEPNFNQTPSAVMREVHSRGPGGARLPGLIHSLVSARAYLRLVLLPSSLLLGPVMKEENGQMAAHVVLDYEDASLACLTEGELQDMVCTDQLAFIPCVPSKAGVVAAVRAGGDEAGLNAAGMNPQYEQAGARKVSNADAAAHAAAPAGYVPCGAGKPEDMNTSPQQPSAAGAATTAANGAAAAASADYKCYSPTAGADHGQLPSKAAATAAPHGPYLGGYVPCGYNPVAVDPLTQPAGRPGAAETAGVATAAEGTSRSKQATRLPGLRKVPTGYEHPTAAAAPKLHGLQPAKAQLQAKQQQQQQQIHKQQMQPPRQQQTHKPPRQQQQQLLQQQDSVSSPVARLLRAGEAAAAQLIPSQQMLQGLLQGGLKNLKVLLEPMSFPTLTPQVRQQLDWLTLQGATIFFDPSQKSVPPPSDVNVLVITQAHGLHCSIQVTDYLVSGALVVSERFLQLLQKTGGKLRATDWDKAGECMFFASGVCLLLDRSLLQSGSPAALNTLLQALLAVQQVLPVGSPCDVYVASELLQQHGVLLAPFREHGLLKELPFISQGGFRPDTPPVISYAWQVASLHNQRPKAPADPRARPDVGPYPSTLRYLLVVVADTSPSMSQADHDRIQNVLLNRRNKTVIAATCSQAQRFLLALKQQL